jgi:hypothetical protein
VEGLEEIEILAAILVDAVALRGLQHRLGHLSGVRAAKGAEGGAGRRQAER